MPNLIVGESLRVLLVSTAENLRDSVRDGLAGRAGDHRLYWVSQPELAPTRARDVLPHVILMDDAGGGPNVISLIRTLSAQVPGAVIVALVEPGEMDRARQAMLAGARGFLTKPVDPEDMVATLRQMLAGPRGPEAEVSRPAQAGGRVVVFCAPKGGTGRTMLAVNTAVSLHRASRADVALMDADYSAPALDVALNLDSGHDVSVLLPDLARVDEQLVRSVLARHASGVQVLLAPPPADLLHPISLPQVQQILVLLKRMFPWVVVDLGLPLDEMAFAFLDGADLIVMTVLPEMVGLRNTSLMLDQLYGRGYPDRKIWLVLNRAGMPGGVSEGDIEDRVGVKIQQTVPNDQALATHAVNRGVPLVMSHPRSALARAVSRLARELRDDLTPEPARGNGRVGGWLGRLRPGATR